MRVLSDVVDDVEPDLSMREAKLGDRYLLCSDGLSSVVSFETIQETMAAGADPAATCEQLVQLALRSGAPDNVTCIVADVVDAVGTPTDTTPVVVGAASSNRAQPRPSRPPGGGGSAAERAAELTSSLNQVPDPPETDGRQRSRTARVFRLGLAGLLVVVILGAGGYGAYRWSQDQYFVGDSKGSVAVFRGLSQDVGPVKLSSVASVAADLPLTQLPPYNRTQVEDRIVTDSQSEAQGVVAKLRQVAADCRAVTATPTPTPSTGPTTKPSAAPKTTATPTPTVTSGAGGTTAEDCAGLG
jgi:protein phosphatase